MNKYRCSNRDKLGFCVESGYLRGSEQCTVQCTVASGFLRQKTELVKTKEEVAVTSVYIYSLINMLKLEASRAP